MTVNLPHRPLTNIDLIKIAKILKIPYFCGVFMRNALPQSGVKTNEAAIVNLDDKTGSGTHWIAYRKTGKNVE